MARPPELIDLLPRRFFCAQHSHGGVLDELMEVYQCDLAQLAVRLATASAWADQHGLTYRGGSLDALEDVEIHFGRELVSGELGADVGRFYVGLYARGSNFQCPRFQRLVRAVLADTVRSNPISRRLVERGVT